MRGSNTKERILDAALELFASQGYEQVTMEDIAGAVDIKAPSLYKHFAGKQEIYDSLVEKSEQVFYNMSASMGISSDTDQTSQSMTELDLEAIKGIGLALFDFLLHDTYTVQFRRMLSMRQYSSSKIAEYYLRFYIVQPVQFQGAAAAAMARAAGAGKVDAEFLGMEFYAPIYLLISRCDIEPAYESEAKRLLEKHIEYFFNSQR